MEEPVGKLPDGYNEAMDEVLDRLIERAERAELAKSDLLNITQDKDKRTQIESTLNRIREELSKLREMRDLRKGKGK